jgi:hypothetical protein
MNGGVCCADLTAEALAMTLCPIALAAGCARCPAFKVCPLKTVLGDAPKAPPPAAKAAPRRKP